MLMKEEIILGITSQTQPIYEEGWNSKVEKTRSAIEKSMIDLCQMKMLLFRKRFWCFRYMKFFPW